MDKNQDNNTINNNNITPNAEVESTVDTSDTADNRQPETDEQQLTEAESLAQQLEASQAEVEKEKKEYLFLMAEFDNFRKRTIKERAELIKNAGERVLEGLLPIIDDFERSIQAIGSSAEASSALEGVTLIYNKFVKYLEQNGVKPIETAPGTEFDTEIHEAVTTFPVEDPDLKGRIIDTALKGYMLNDKVLRHAKVVVGK